MPDPFDPTDLLFSYLSSGFSAVALSAREEDGRFVPHISTETGVKVRVRRYDKSDQGTDEIISFLDMLRLVDEGHSIGDIASPRDDVLFWVAAGYIVRPRRSELVLRTQHKVATCGVLNDFRGLAQMPLSSFIVPNPRPAISPTLGAHVTRALLSTKIPGARARNWEAKERVGSDDVPSVVASAIADYFHQTAYGDSGMPVHEFLVSQVDSLTKNVQTVLQGPASGVDDKTTGRRNRLHERVNSFLMGDAFGQGIHSPRSNHTVVSIDVDSDHADEPSTGGRRGLAAELVSTLSSDDTLDAFDRREQAREELAKYLDQAGLSKREMDVLRLKLEGFQRNGERTLTEKEIAAQLGITEGTVKTLWNRGRQKVVKAKLKQA